MQVEQEYLCRVWAEHNIVLPSFTWLPDNEDSTSNGTLTAQRSDKPADFFDLKITPATVPWPIKGQISLPSSSIFPIHSMQTMELLCSLRERTWSRAQAYLTPIFGVLVCVCMCITWSWIQRRQQIQDWSSIFPPQRFPFWWDPIKLCWFWPNIWQRWLHNLQQQIMLSRHHHLQRS